MSEKEMIHPNQLLKEGKFDIDVSHQSENTQSTKKTLKSHQTTIVDETSIDAFLISENINTVDL